MTPSRLGLAAFLAALLAFPAAADVSLVFQSNKPDASWEEVLYLAMGLALSDEGYSSVRDLPAEYRLVTVYELGSERVTAHLTLWSAAPAVLAAVDANFTLEGDLDRQISDAVHTLFAEAAIKKPTDAQPSIRGLLVLPPPVDPFTTGTGPVTHVVAGAALYWGEWSERARFGATVGTQGGWFFPWEKLRVLAAVRLTETRDFNNPDILGGPLYLTLVGLDAELGMGLVAGLRAFAEVSGGAAVLSVADPWRNKTVPYADAGVRAEVLAWGVAWGADLRLQAVFAPEVLFLSLVPTLTVGKEF